jgi:lipid-binding SYLF domain-containing protein
MTKKNEKLYFKIFTFILLAVFLLSSQVKVSAISKAEIDSNVKIALNRLSREVGRSDDLLAKAKGVLVFPDVYKAGFVFGGEYGEGSLLFGKQTMEYYSLASGSFGWQLGAQKKSIVILFMEDEALNKLRNSANWKIGADASVAIVSVGADGFIDSQITNQPVIAFVFDQKGLMYNLTLEGTKFTKLDKKS